MAVYQNSRYINTRLAYSGVTPVLAIRKRYRFNLENAVYYTLLQGDTLESLAYQYYNNTRLYWAILDANPQIQSELNLKPGDVLCIPSFEEVVKVIG